jgi:uncharacterized membrane protein YidH (DUF202 family)
LWAQGAYETLNAGTMTQPFDQQARRPETSEGIPASLPLTPSQQPVSDGHLSPPYQYSPGLYPSGFLPPPPHSYSGFTSRPPVNNGLGIASLTFAIVALVLFSFGLMFGDTSRGIAILALVFASVIIGVAGVVLGFAARRRVKRGEADNGGVAVAGIVVGIVAVVAILISIVVLALAAYAFSLDTNWQHCMGEHMGNADVCHGILGR